MYLLTYSLTHVQIGDIEELLNFLCQMSRSTCVTIDEIMHSQHQTSLSDFLESVIKSPQALLALKLWCVPVQRAVVDCIRLHNVSGSAQSAAYRV